MQLQNVSKIKKFKFKFSKKFQIFTKKNLLMFAAINAYFWENFCEFGIAFCVITYFVNRLVLKFSFEFLSNNDD